MRLWVVAKAPVDLADCFAIIGVFTDPVKANGAVSAGGAGSYMIAPVEHDRNYREGTLLDVRMVVKVGVGR